MAKHIYVDRSRYETYQRCARQRWYEYHQDGTGIVPARKPLALCVGGSVHVGLEVLLREGAALVAQNRVNVFDYPEALLDVEDEAVIAALDDFSQHRGALAVDVAEAAAQAAPTVLDVALDQTARELGLSADDPQLRELTQQRSEMRSAIDDWLWNEQAALVEGLVRAYARRRLRPLLEEFEVLEVEREGTWELSYRDDDPDAGCFEGYHIMFMSRPDALLRSRADNSLYLLSFKTAAQWDTRKKMDAEHDMQGLSEGIEVERRLGEWWNALHVEGDTHEPISDAMRSYLRALPAPPRITGIRYEYLLKGSRWEDKDLSQRFGTTVWAQRSHLTRAYQDPEGRWSWSYDYVKEDGSSSKLYYKTWRAKPVWESMSMKAWMDMLDASTEAMSAYDSTTGAEPRLLGWHSPAQTAGFTTEHPLDSVFIPPITVYRSDDQLRDLVDQMEAQERRIAEGMDEVAAAEDAGERRHALNVHFGQTRRACAYPSLCAFEKVCFGGEDIQAAPLESGLFKRRTPNHPQEGAGGYE